MTACTVKAFSQRDQIVCIARQHHGKRCRLHPVKRALSLVIELRGDVDKAVDAALRIDRERN